MSATMTFTFGVDGWDRIARDLRRLPEEDGPTQPGSMAALIRAYMLYDADQGGDQQAITMRFTVGEGRLIESVVAAALPRQEA